MKKVFFILNLLFLTLSVFGGSVSAAAPTEYIDENGETRTLSTPPTLINNDEPLTDGWYYLDSSQKTAMSFTIGTSAASDPVNIIVNGKVSLPTGSFIEVPENTFVNFYGADESSSFSITHNGQCTIGNFGSSSNDFGNITFNSGTYTVTNTFTTPTPAIGSSNASGGTITVNAAAEVTALSQVRGTPAVGVTEGNKCNINVVGGLLSTIVSGSVCTTNVGEGNLTVTGQGRVQTASNTDYDVSALVEDSTWDIQSGIVGYYDYLGTTSSFWNTIVGGEITVPNPDSDLSDDLLNLAVPQIGKNGTTNSGANGYWNSVTVLPNGNLTLGVEDPDGGFNPATFSVGATGANVENEGAVINNGDVIINSINQSAAYPWSWNNNPGSTLTINSGATLNIWTKGFNNLAPEEDQSGSPGEVTIEGTLNVSNGGTFQNSGNLNIAEGGLISGQNNALNGVIGITEVENTETGTVTLDGTVDLIANTGVFQNFGTLDIGPIGTINGNLTNEAGGTVTSQNPCYYGIKYTPLLSSL